MPDHGGQGGGACPDAAAGPAFDHGGHPLPFSFFPVLLAGALLLPRHVALFAQLSPDLARERSEFERWLLLAPTSPLAVIAQTPLGTGLTLGPPDAEIPLADVAPAKVFQEGGGVYLETGGIRRPLGRYRPVSLGAYTLALSGSPRRPVLGVYGTRRLAKLPAYYPPDASLVFQRSLEPPEQAETVRLLSLEGLEVEATAAGSVSIPIGSLSVRLRVYRIPDPETEESDLMIYFRDETNGHGSYLAGRFLALLPASGGRYLIDFNRARNPFCAYSTVYACPAPWPGNSIPGPIMAGEKQAVDHQ